MSTTDTPAGAISNDQPSEADVDLVTCSVTEDCAKGAADLDSSTADTTSKKRPPRMARSAHPSAPPHQPGSGAVASEAKADSPRGPSKLDQVQVMLLGPNGATIAEIMAITGWQQHSVRGAMAGALKKRGLIITSNKLDGARRYVASKPA